MGTITVDSIGKAYKQYPTRWSRLAEWILPGSKPRHQLKWVLQGVSFTVNPGEALGIIGVNGAGKSTLLKMITGTTQPTTGSVQISGRVAALLELGMGFHPDFTGRQNAFMAGQLLGYGAQEIVALMPAIEAFADIGDYIDQPVRVYSSGMQVRLAFSVATAHRPDVLIVDEALSVGDAYFQHKSFERIRKFQDAGTTILFVSHDFGAIRTLCKRVILLGDGHALRDGSAAEVLDYYNALIAEKEGGPGIQQKITADGQPVTRSGTGAVKLLQVELRDQNGTPALRFGTGDPLTVSITAKTGQAVDSLVAGFMIRDRTGNPIFGTNSWHLRQPLLQLPLHTEASFQFHFPLNLGPGSYSLSVALVDRDTHLSQNYDWQDNIQVFEVINLYRPTFVGVAYLAAQVDVHRSYPVWDLNRHASQVFSQFGEDGIIQRILDVIGPTNRHCVEFGGYDGVTMSNTARLLRKEGWQGGFIEADPELYNKLLDNYRDQPTVRAVQAFVTPDNIEALMDQLGAPADMDLLCIDIDGNDYWVWQAIQRFKPRVVVIEFNGAYPPPRQWVMAYNPAHCWQGNDYYGASPQSLTDLARAKGYELVCCEEQGANLFFVRAEHYPLFAIPDNRLETLYRPARYGLPENAWSHPHFEGPHVAL